MYVIKREPLLVRYLQCRCAVVVVGWCVHEERRDDLDFSTFSLFPFSSLPGLPQSQDWLLAMIEGRQRRSAALARPLSAGARPNRRTSCLGKSYAICKRRKKKPCWNISSSSIYLVSSFCTGIEINLRMKSNNLFWQLIIY